MESFFLDTRAVAHKFGDKLSSSLRRAFLLITLYSQYIAALIKDRDTIIRHGDFIVRTLEGLSVLTGSSNNTISEDLAFLEGKNLITYKKGFGIRYKVNLEYYQDFIQEARDEYTIFKEEEFRKMEEKKGRNSKALKDIADKTTRIIVEADTTDIKALIESFGKDKESDAWLVYLFSHYYKEYTGKDYIWTLVKLNTLKSVWKKDTMYREHPEYALSYSLKKALLTCGKRPLELVWREGFNPDTEGASTPWETPKISDVKMDHLLPDRKTMVLGLMR